MTTTEAPVVRKLIAKCRNGHVVRGEYSHRTGITVTTPGASERGGCWLICPCGSAGMIKWMDVKVVAERACNGVCMGATGPSCSCSCGGENHGAARVYTD